MPRAFSSESSAARACVISLSTLAAGPKNERRSLASMNPSPTSGISEDVVAASLFEVQRVLKR